MPDLYDCLQTAIDANEIDMTRAQRAQAEFLELKQRYARTMPEAAAAAAAERDVKKATQAATAERRHSMVAQLQRLRANALFVQRADRPDLALKSVLAFGEGRGHKVFGVEATHKSIRRQLLGEMSQVLETFGKDLLGRTRKPALLRNVAREMHREATGDAAAAELATAARAAFERARAMFDAHGGHIGELADFGMPHAHDARAMKAAGFEAWRDAVSDRLDWSRIEDFATGQPFAPPGRKPDPRAAERFLKDVYDGIVTESWNRRVPSMVPSGRALYNRRADHRLLHFRSADDWLDYNEAFGAAEPYSAIIRHVDTMARDIALMRVLGPNPRGGLEHMIQTAERRAHLAGDKRMVDRVKAAADTARNMLDDVTGAANDPIRYGMAKFFGGVRALLTGAQLGSAPLSAVTDLWTMRMAAKTMGMNPGNLMSRSVQLMSSHATRETAASMGYVADVLAETGSAQARFLQDGVAPEIAQRIASGVIRASGLAFWTDMHRLAFQMEMSGYLGANAGRALDQVDEPLRRLLTSRGITAEDWAKLSDPELLFRPEGGAFIAPVTWRRAAIAAGMGQAEADGLATRLGAIIEEQLEFAVPTASLEGRAMLRGVGQPGTFAGELIRSVTMYKSFALSITINQIRRAMAQRAAGGSPALYAAELIAGLTVFGGLAVQLKEISKGRDPRPMTDPRFWGAAFLQGGGVGIFGDFLSSGVSRAGGSFAETLAGPVVGLGGDVLRAGVSNAGRVLEGREPLLGRDLVNLGRRYTPGSSLWYGRLALDRTLWDPMQRLLDPEAETQWRRAMQRARRERGVEYWWAPGEAEPARAPELGNIAGGR